LKKKTDLLPVVKTQRTTSSLSTFEEIKESVTKDWLNHAAGFFRALALVQSDVLFLQGFMLMSSKLTVYRLAIRKETTATAYALLFAGLSAFATFTLLSERIVWLNEEEEAIWAAHFDNLTQPMFKKLMRCAKIHTVPPQTDPNALPAAPALSDYFSAKYPFEGDRVLTIGGTPTLSLLLEGKARIVRDLARGEGDYRLNKKGEVKYPLKPRSIKPVLVERGPGFNGEVSFTERQGHSDKSSERAEKVRARADVTFMPDSRYVLWDTPKLEAMLRGDPSLRNALLACLGKTTAKKLYDMTYSLGKANEHAQGLKHMLYEEFYKQEVLDMVRHTLVETVACGGEAAAHAPNGASVLLPRLKQLQAERGISNKVHQKAIQALIREQGIDLQKATENGDSLLTICDTEVGLSSSTHTAKHKELKRVIKDNKARNRVVRMDAS
jgi:hypothetical protein